MRWRHPPRLMSFKEEQFKEPEMGIAPLNPWYKKLVAVASAQGCLVVAGGRGPKGKEAAFRPKPTDCNSFCSCRFGIEFTLSGKQRL